METASGSRIIPSKPFRLLEHFLLCHHRPPETVMNHSLRCDAEEGVCVGYSSETKALKKKRSSGMSSVDGMDRIDFPLAPCREATIGRDAHPTPFPPTFFPLTISLVRPNLFVLL